MVSSIAVVEDVVEAISFVMHREVAIREHWIGTDVLLLHILLLLVIIVVLLVSFSFISDIARPTSSSSFSTIHKMAVEVVLPLLSLHLLMASLPSRVMWTRAILISTVVVVVVVVVAHIQHEVVVAIHLCRPVVAYSRHLVVHIARAIAVVGHSAISISISIAIAIRVIGIHAARIRLERRECRITEM